MNNHKLESALVVSTWAKAHYGFCPISLDTYQCVLLMDLEVLANIEGQVSFIVKVIVGQYGLGTIHSR